MTFERMADRRPVVTPLIRDDGVAFSLRGAGGGADLPHDLVHLLVETELRVRDAIGRAEALADAAVRLSRGEPVHGARPPGSRRPSSAGRPRP